MIVRVIVTKKDKFLVMSPLDSDWFLNCFVGSPTHYELHPDDLKGVFRIKDYFQDGLMYCAFQWKHKKDSTWVKSDFAIWDPVEKKDLCDAWIRDNKFKGQVSISDTRDLVPVKEEPCLFTLPFNWTLNKNYVKSNPLLEQQLIDEAVKKGQSTARMTQREWPWGKRLGYRIDKAKDQISFFWEPDRAANK
jgi:hypothetical protein